MAQLINPLFGNISGRVGDFVFKTINGKTFMYYRPKNKNKKEKSDNYEYDSEKRTINLIPNVFKKTKAS